MADLVAKYVADLKIGDTIWVKGEITSIDSDGEISFDYLFQAKVLGDEDSEEEYTQGAVYDKALMEMYGQAGRPPLPGDEVYSQSSPGTHGLLVAIVKGVGVVDWSYENPEGPAALSNLSIGTLRRRGE